MAQEQVFHVADIPQFRRQALIWASGFNQCCYLDSNHYTDPYSEFDVLIAAGSVSVYTFPVDKPLYNLDTYLSQNNTYKFGFLSYDLKNKIEDLYSANDDYLNFPLAFFFEPRHLIRIKNQQISIISPDARNVFEKISTQAVSPGSAGFTGKVSSRFSKAEYLETVKQLQEHIHRGDIYEINFCQEFYADKTTIDPVQLFSRLNSLSPTPFAAFFKNGSQYIISATPERFLSKRTDKLLSQPIKGTAKRGITVAEDEAIKKQLRNDAKEQAENVMIVDLVRNDLTRCAKPGTVTVEELFGIYSFKQVHQMISTVACTISLETSFSDILKATFPMGSMTGAPKIRAMQLIEKFERSKRGVFSGALGYVSPSGDFDFNVIIRTLLYNVETAYLSFQVGSAITAASVAQKEYEECLLKAQAIMQALENG